MNGYKQAGITIPSGESRSTPAASSHCAPDLKNKRELDFLACKLLLLSHQGAIPNALNLVGAARLALTLTELGQLHAAHANGASSQADFEAARSQKNGVCASVSGLADCYALSEVQVP